MVYSSAALASLLLGGALPNGVLPNGVLPNGVLLDGVLLGGALLGGVSVQLSTGHILVMNLEFFFQQRKASWQRMESLLQQARSDPGNLSAQELDEMGLLYRAIASDLALAQRDFPSQQVTRYLNQLVGRAHALIYRSEPLRWHQFMHFYRTEFPQLYRKLLPYTLAAFVLFLAPAIVAFWSVAVNPDWIYVIEGPGIANLVAQVELMEDRLETCIDALRTAVDLLERTGVSNEKLRHARALLKIALNESRRPASH